MKTSPCIAERRTRAYKNIIMIGRDEKVWRRDGEHDVDFATWRLSGHIQTPEAVLPSLLLPFTDHPRASIEMLNGKLYKYFYRSGSALYQKDADSRPKKIDILAGGRRWVLERLTVEEKTYDPSIFTVGCEPFHFDLTSAQSL